VKITTDNIGPCVTALRGVLWRSSHHSSLNVIHNVVSQKRIGISILSWPLTFFFRKQSTVLRWDCVYFFSLSRWRS